MRKSLNLRAVGAAELCLCRDLALRRTASPPSAVNWFQEWLPRRDVQFCTHEGNTRSRKNPPPLLIASGVSVEPGSSCSWKVKCQRRHQEGGGLLHSRHRYLTPTPTPSVPTIGDMKTWTWLQMLKLLPRESSHKVLRPPSFFSRLHWQKCWNPDVLLCVMRQGGAQTQEPENILTGTSRLLRPFMLKFLPIFF